jgi:subtilisin family serine protease
VAPGEKVLSCAAGTMAENIANKLPNDTVPNYVEDSGTSMAAPHVSGAAAAFLSIKNEFIGKPEVIKQILLSTATDLGRERQFQGAGLLDLMRAIQSL